MSAEQKVEVLAEAIGRIRVMTCDRSSDPSLTYDDDLGLIPWCGTGRCAKHVPRWGMINAEASKALREIEG